ncbi:hypothetical protein DRP07_08295 [Archaeoglobales archaeon]|nr:MAG: hypothetical protein DRP07_08295 [Archaeoglobales archaeon]
MMSKKRKKYTREFKISVITELDSGKTIAQVSREYNLHPSMVIRWKKEYNKQDLHSEEMELQAMKVE